MKRALVLVTLLSFAGCATASPTPAPTVTPALPADAPVRAAEPLCLSAGDELLLAKHIARLETENAELKKGPALPTWALVLLGVGVVGAGFATGYGVAKAAK